VIQRPNCCKHNKDAELLYGTLAGKVALNAIILLYTALKCSNNHSKYVIYRMKQKKGNFWKTQQKLKKCKKKKLLTEIEPLQLAF